MIFLRLIEARVRVELSRGLAVGRLSLGIAILFFSLASAAKSEAQTPYQLGDIEFSGSACGAPEQTSVVFDADAKTVSILFSELFLQVQSGPFATRVKMKRLRCNVRVPITLAPGFALSGVDADFRGYADVSEGATARIFSRQLLWVPLDRYFPLYRRGRFIEKFRGPASEDFFVTEPIRFNERSVARSCGKKVYFDMELILEASTQLPNAYSLLTLDTIDLSGQTLDANSQALKLAVSATRCP